MRVTIVTTTINVPVLLKDYASNARRYNHDDVVFIVVGDKKTPARAKSFCRELKRASGYEFYFFDVKAQEEYLKKYPELSRHLPYNSIQRRNVGILFAYENGAEVIITIDDDNFVKSGDFIGRHLIVGKKLAINEIKSSTGWVNVCGFLKEKNNFPFYHRGFPLGARFKEDKLSTKFKKVRVAVNAGFWLGEPDIDATTRLTIPIEVTDFPRKNNFALAQGTWSPFNSQNTALVRECVPAYFLSPLVGRYDDIWASYIVKRIADHLKQAIVFGHPVVYQERNPHNYLNDLEKERRGMRLTDLFCRCLMQIKLKEKTYQECYREIYQALKKFLAKEISLNQEEKKFFLDYLSGMEVWQKTIGRVSA